MEAAGIEPAQDFNRCRTTVNIAFAIER